MKILISIIVFVSERRLGLLMESVNFIDGLLVDVLLSVNMDRMQLTAENFIPAGAVVVTAAEHEQLL